MWPSIHPQQRSQQPEFIPEEWLSESQFPIGSLSRQLLETCNMAKKAPTVAKKKNLPPITHVALGDNPITKLWTHSIRAAIVESVKNYRGRKPVALDDLNDIFEMECRGHLQKLIATGHLASVDAEGNSRVRA